MIGQSGCGKSTLLSSFQQNKKTVKSQSNAFSGEVPLVDGRDIYNTERKRSQNYATGVRHGFSRPNPFPTNEIFNKMCVLDYAFKQNWTQNAWSDIVESSLRSNAQHCGMKFNEAELFDSAQLL